MAHNMNVAEQGAGQAGQRLAVALENLRRRQRGRWEMVHLMYLRHS